MPIAEHLAARELARAASFQIRTVPRTETYAELEAMVDAHNKAVGPHASQKNVTDIVRDAIAEMLQRKKRR
jgi:hypothetical protein